MADDDAGDVVLFESEGLSDDGVDHSRDICPALRDFKRMFTWQSYFGPCLEAGSMAHDRDPARMKAVFGEFHKIQDQDVDGIDGNIYRYLAFFHFGTIFCEKAGEEMILTPPSAMHSFCMMSLGILGVILLQIFAPIALLATYYNDLIESYNWAAWKDYDWSQWMVVITGWILLFLFILSNYFTIMNDTRSGRLLEQMARDLDDLDQPVWFFWLIADALINCWVAFSLSVATFAVIYQSETVVSVLFNALGLAFIAAADDIASDFGFLDGVWDDRRMGRLNEALWRVMRPENRIRRSKSSLVPQPIYMGYTIIPRAVYALTKLGLIFLLVLAIPSPFFLASQATPGVGPQQKQAFKNILDWASR